MRNIDNIRRKRILIFFKIRANDWRRVRCSTICSTTNDKIKRSIFGVTIPETSVSRTGVSEGSRIAPEGGNVKTIRLLTDPRHVAIWRWDFLDIKSHYKVGDLFISPSLAFSFTIVRGTIAVPELSEDHAAMFPAKALAGPARRRARDESIGEIFA